MEEVLSQFRGRCFTLTSPHLFHGQEYLTLSLQAPNNGPEVLIYVHEPGQQFYLIADSFPFEVSTQAVSEASDCVFKKQVGYSTL